MNWLFGLLFLIVIFAFYYLLGDFSSKIFRLNNVDSQFKVILGFIVVFFLGFVVGFPAQVLKVSWNVYFIAFSIILLIVSFLLIKKITVHKGKKSFLSKNSIKEHIRMNWFIYFLCFCFIAFYSMSYLAYSYVGYDDAYYITKMSSFVGRSQFLRENYFTGFVDSHANVLTYRLFNSYELTYAYFATLFHISIPFFAKIVMSVNNYLITFFVLKLIADKFVDKKYSQYCLIFIPIFMIPQASANINTLLRIDFYDFWQFLLASFYGGNIVRNIALPVYMIEFYYLYKNFNIRHIILIGITSIAFISFSSIFVMWLIMCSMTYVLIVMFKVYRDKWKFTFFNTNKEITFIVFCFVVFYCLNTAISFVLNKFIKNYGNIMNRIYDFVTFSTGNLFFIAAFIGVILFLYKHKDDFVNKEVEFYCYALLIPYTFIVLGRFNAILYLSSGCNDFVIKRFIDSIRTIDFIILGIIFYSLLRRINKVKYFAILSVCMCLGVPTYVYTNQEKMYRLSQNFTSGIERPGYNWRLPFQNDQMMPQVTVDVGEYFNNLPKDSYKLLSPTLFEWNGATINCSAFLMISNQLQIVPVKDYYQGRVIDEERGISPYQFVKLDRFMNNRESYGNIVNSLKKNKIQYVFITNKEVAKSLVKEGHSIVLENKSVSKEYYLIKLSFNY